MIKQKPKSFFVVSSYNEDVSWVNVYTDSYLIYDKSHSLPEYKKIKKIENYGYNQRDICLYIFENYESLPDLVVFLQGKPYEHCSKEIFDELIYNESFTYLETPSPGAPDRERVDGYYTEYNLHNRFSSSGHANLDGYGEGFKTIDEFMNFYFTNYVHIDMFRFSPGSQYIVEKRQIEKYPKPFWYSLMNLMNAPKPVHSHLIERVLPTILLGDYIVNMKNL